MRWYSAMWSDPQLRKKMLTVVSSLYISGWSLFMMRAALKASANWFSPPVVLVWRMQCNICTCAGKNKHHVIWTRSRMNFTCLANIHGKIHTKCEVTKLCSSCGAMSTRLHTMIATDLTYIWTPLKKKKWHILSAIQGLPMEKSLNFQQHSVPEISLLIYSDFNLWRPQTTFELYENQKGSSAYNGQPSHQVWTSSSFTSLRYRVQRSRRLMCAYNKRHHDGIDSLSAFRRE